MALVICTWLWGDKYPEHYVTRLARGLKRNLKQPYRFICVTDRQRNLPNDIEQTPIVDRELISVKGCFARLRMFDPEWQKKIGADERLVCIDLDAVVTGELDGLFDRPDDFTILYGVNTSNPCPFNGSLWMLLAGYRWDVWTDFSLEAAQKVQYHEFPDDQAWFWAKMWEPGRFTDNDGVYAFKKRGWPSGDDLPANAKVVAFPGWRDPSKFEHLDWVKANWID